MEAAGGRRPPSTRQDVTPGQAPDPVPHTDRRALAWVAGGAIVALVWLAHPFGTALLLGALMAFTTQPAYARLVRWTGQPLLASLGMVLGAGLLIVGSAVGFATLFVSNAVVLTNVVREGLRPGGALYVWVGGVSSWLMRFGISPEALAERLRAGMADLASGAAAAAATVASSTFHILLGLFFALLTMHVMLRHWPRIVAVLEDVSPLRPDYARALLEEFRRVGRTALSGTVVTGLVQGALATIGYWIARLPEPLFFGIATAIASLVPAVGTLLVWVPVGIYLFATDHAAMAAFELVWGALVVVGFSDYVVRPRLVGEEGMPAILTFLALFGGLEVLGLPGLIAGPVVMALAIAALRLYAREVRAERAASRR